MAFLPKGEEPDDVNHGGGIFRAADAVRARILKNTDNKAIVGAHNNAIVFVLANQSLWIQRGFTRGRQLVANVLDLDTASRLAALSPELLPVLFPK